MKLTIKNRLKLCWEILTAKSGHAHCAQEKMLSTFIRGYEAGVRDTDGTTKLIPVTDRMPESSHEPVILWNGRRYSIGLCLGLLPMAPGHVGFFNMHEERLSGITHWAPVPQQEEWLYE